MNRRRYFPPTNDALTDDLKAQAAALRALWDAADEAAQEANDLAGPQLAKDAQAADDEALRKAIEGGTREPKVTTAATDLLAAKRRIAAARVEATATAEAQAAHEMRAAIEAASSELIDVNQLRANEAADAYRTSIKALIVARNHYNSAVRDLGRAWTDHLDAEWKRQDPKPRHQRRINRDDPGPRTEPDLLPHPRGFHDVPASELADILNHDADRHEFHDPRTEQVPDTSHKPRAERTMGDLVSRP